MLPFCYFYGTMGTLNIAKSSQEVKTLTFPMHNHVVCAEDRQTVHRKHLMQFRGLFPLSDLL